MTGFPGRGAPARDGSAAPVSLRDAVSAIGVTLALGLAFRLIMAYAIPDLSGSGFRNDLISFQGWAADLAKNGLSGFYTRPGFHDYTPGYLYALWVIGLVGQVVGGVGGLIKLPAILSDVALALIVYWMLRHDLGVTERRARIGALLVLANPVTWFDSVIWGQVDSVGVVFLLLAIRELWKGRSERSAIFTVIAALTKPQLGILVPIVALVTIRRALRPDGGFGLQPEPGPSGIGPGRWLRGPVRILSTGVAGLLTAFALSLPFGLSVIAPSTQFPFVQSGLVDQLTKTAAGYPYVTVNADNPWALVTAQQDGRALGLAQNGAWLCDAVGPVTPVGQDPAPCAADQGEAHVSILGIPALIVGDGSFVGVTLAVSLLVARRPDRLTILIGVAVLALAFFVVPTRVHERYLFPFVAVGAVLAAVSWRWALGYVIACAATFLNMYVVLTTIYPGNPRISDWLGIGPSLRTWGWVAAIALAHTAVFAWSLVQLRGSALRRVARETGLASVESREGDEAPAEEPEVFVDAPPDLGRSRAPGTASIARARLLPAWEAGDPGGGRSWFERARDRIRQTPIRADRSALLVRERGGRLDRLDLWLVVVLVVATLFLRMFRLAEPVQMHFDEVYHARTATEFLSLWRYGISKEIYEWTHPHLAKYAMAAGIVLFAGHDVEATSDLGKPVRDAAIEPRHDDTSSARQVAGDRLWVATGSELVAYDLQTRKQVMAWPVAGASAVGVDSDLNALVVGTDTGELRSMDLTELDAYRGQPIPETVAPQPLTTLSGSVAKLVAFAGGGRMAALLPNGAVTVVDDVGGGILAEGTVRGAKDMVAAGTGPALVTNSNELTDPSAALSAAAKILKVDQATLDKKLRDAGTADVVLKGTLDNALKERLQGAIDTGDLTGMRIEDVGWLAVTGSDGVTFLTAGGDVASTIPLEDAGGLALITGVEDGTQLDVTSRDEAGRPILARINVSGDQATKGPNLKGDTIRLPGAGQRVLYDPATKLIHVLGATPDGRATTVYVIEPHANVAFADHKLPFAPSAWVMDTAPQYPTEDRSAVLALSPGGKLGSLDMRHYAFAWRLPGVLAGAVSAALLYLLARILFRRRSVAVIAGLLGLFDGMMFVQSRIGMNDVYVGVFILAAYVVFAALWSGMIRHRHAFWLVLPAVGVFLGLALASKWVAAYAMGALGILVIGRSALGRVVLILGLIGATTFLGWMAIAVPEGKGLGNLTFMLIMVALTLAATAIVVLKPIAWSTDEVRFAIGGPGALGVLVALVALAMGRASTSYTIGPMAFTPLQLALALIVLSLGISALFIVAGRLGFGPLAPPPAPDDPASLTEPAAPAPDGWLRLGWGFGIPAAWIGICLLVIPIVVYVISYIPWGYIDNKAIVPGFPVASHAGPNVETLAQLTQRMYDYHNTLSEPHAASSPWWAWPLDLKPVWFYQGSFADSTAASIYDAGNVVIWWLGIPAMAFVSWMAYKRRSIGLALIVVGFLCQWISWARIDRAAFQYHYYTSLPFVILALAYLIAELWHGASRATWLLARVAAVLTLLGPALLWVGRGPLCWYVGVERVNPGSQACVGNPANLNVTPSVAGIVVVGLVIGLLLIRQLSALSRPRPDRRPVAVRDLALLVLTGVAGVIGLVIARQLPSEDPILAVPGFMPEIGSLLVLIPLSLVALPILTARDSRRFAVGMVAAIGGWFVVLYPNISALPLPSAVVNAYQGLLPTYLYPFQFPVNTLNRSGAISFSDPRLIVLGLALLMAVVVVGYATWVWRIALAERAAAQGGDGSRLVGGEA